MIVPNKFYSFDDSILKKLPHLLDHETGEKTTIKHLYRTTRKYFATVEEYLIALEILYVLDMISIDPDTEAITYAK